MNNGNGLIAYDSLRPAAISSADYTNTLAAEALHAGLFTEEDIHRLQNGLMETLAEVIGYYSRNQSTSVKTETAKELTLSILYNIDTHLLSLGDHRIAAEELREKRLSDLYGKGYLINSKRFERAKVLYARARYTRLKNASMEYNKTLDVKLKNYFASYDARFNAHAKAYVTLSEYGIRGAFRMDQMEGMLNRLLAVNAGRSADITLDPGTDGAGE
ncbi:MAG: DUF6179 domain-containing protein [Eubacteriales bacterium]